MWGYLLPMCFCVATTPLIMSQHSQVVTLFQMPQKCHEKYPCTKIFIPSFFQNFPKFKNFCHLKIFQIIHFFKFLPFENIHMENINTFWVNFNQNAYVFKIFHQKPLKKLRNLIKKNLQISPHSWFESMKVWFSRNFFVGQLFTGLFVCWVSLLLRILSFLRFYGCLKIIFWDFFQKFLNTNRSR